VRGEALKAAFLSCEITSDGDRASAHCTIERNSFFPACQTTTTYTYRGIRGEDRWFFDGTISNMDPVGTCIYYYECLHVRAQMIRVGDPPNSCYDDRPPSSRIALRVEGGDGVGPVETEGVIASFVERENGIILYVRALAKASDGYEYYIEFLTPPLDDAPVDIEAVHMGGEESRVRVYYADGRLAPLELFASRSSTGTFSFTSVAPHYVAGTFALDVEGEFKAGGEIETQTRHVEGIFQILEPEKRQWISESGAAAWLDGASHQPGDVPVRNPLEIPQQTR